MAHIQYQRGDIFEAKTQVIVNTVNCQGIMGKGLALAFKQRYPEMFPVYQQECKTGKLRIGRPTLYKASHPWILNFPTKDTWRANSKLEYLEKGLQYFIENYKKVGITSISFPKLGAQNGKLSWDDVGPLMAKYLSQLDIEIYIYIAEGDQEYQYNEPHEAIEDTIETKLWAAFNEIALSIERLQTEISLSLREAKRVFAKRQEGEFTTLAEVENIEKLAKISKEKIQAYFSPELPLDIARRTSEKPQNKKTNKSPRSKKKTISSVAVLAQQSIALF